MTRGLVCCILISLLSVAAAAAAPPGPSVSEQVGRIKVGRKIKVKLQRGASLRGRMGAATADGFTLNPGDAKAAPAREIRFSEAQSVKPDGMTTGQKWAVAGGVWIVLIVLGSLV